MNDQPTNTTRLQRRLYESAFWVVAITSLWSLDLWTKLSDRARTGVGPDEARLVVDQLTSGVAALLMVAFVMIWVRHFPLVRGQALRSGMGHFFGSIVFAFGHFLLIVLMRIVAYAVYLNLDYVWWGDPVGNLIFEYQKDVKIYLAMVATITAYRYWRAQEAARNGQVAKRLVVQTGTGEHFIPMESIECLTAARNYVSVFTAEREYVVRETMANLETRLPAAQFARSHRSHIVNLARIKEVRNAPSGGGQMLCLDSGRTVPIGRNYRDKLREQMAGTAV